MTDADFASSPGSAAGQPPGGDGSPQESAESRIADLEAKLAAATAEAERQRDEWLRAKAETDNVRRRGQEDVARAHRFGLESFAGSLLAVKDSLDAALAVENPSLQSFKEGVELTGRQLDSAFEKFAIKPIAPVGEKFDPHRHQAISQVESTQEPNTVVNVLQKGYMLNDRVLRPALVTVAAAP
ncbi:MAG: nucleotide exchange factor GrpE, partial [Usitatibacter sp.]